jgi:2-C-methyl-D-erythritol 4-phosphate cytidylyltransferase
MRHDQWSAMSLIKSPPRIVALVPSAGVGARAQPPALAGKSDVITPKQYRLLSGVPMLRRSVQALLNDPRIDQVRVIVASGDPLAAQCLAGLPRTICCSCGGPTRAQTVLNGLQDAQLQAQDWVLVHDAARPGLPADALARLIDSCLPSPVGGLLAMPVADTVKRSARSSQNTVGQTVARESLWLAQTPQMFRAGMLEQALISALECKISITDESSALEAAGHAPLLVQGSALNVKVTWPEDFEWVQSWL